MSINRDMRRYMLQKKQKIKSASGAEKYIWVDEGQIDVAVYLTDQVTISINERYKDATHTGLTHCKSIDSKIYRLKSDDKVYQIESCNTQLRLTNLILKEVDANV